MECLDANVVQDLMSGALESGARTAVMGHLDTCEECRQLLSVTAREAARAPKAENTAIEPEVEIGLDATALRNVGLAATTMQSADTGLEATALPSDPKTPVRIRAQTSAGRKFGRYTLIEKLGAGAMGIVWRAEDPELGRKVALKLLKRPDASLTDRLVFEAQSMAQVNHPNVVTVYEVGVAAGETYIAMELVEGKSLRGWQTAGGHTIPELVEAYIAAGRGLAAAHARGIIHRDFKPDNVLVGNDERVRVTDFGLAAAKPSAGVASAIGDVNLTTAGSVLGTPAYMAPEQFTGGNVDPRTDQFNFCVALYEALYGERPFAGKTFEELGDNVCEGKTKAPPTGTRVSRGLRAIVLRGMSPRPGDRFPTMDHLLTELGRDRARPWRRTSIATAALAGVLVLGLASDWIVRDRVGVQISQSFAATGKQTERAVTLQTRQFQGLSNLVVLFKALLDVMSYRDQADFGLSTTEQDAAERKAVRDTLTSQDWNIVRELGQHRSEVAVTDYKGRLMYTSAAPAEWNGDLLGLPAIKQALAAGKGYFVSIVRYDSPPFVSSRLFGATPPPGLAFMFTRTLDHLGEAGGLFMQFIDGQDMLAVISLDDTQLSLVALDGTSIGTVPATLVATTLASGAPEEATAGGTTYRVQARTIRDLENHPIGHIVMARPLESVLELFPAARLVFALTAFAALLVAIATALRARRITGARV